MDYIEQRKKNALLLFKDIKDILAGAHKHNRKNPGNHKSQTVRVSYDGIQESVFDRKTQTWKNGAKEYYISVNDRQIVRGIDSLNEIAAIFSLLISECERQRKVRGWGGLVLSTHVDRQGYGGPNWVVPTVRSVRKITLADAPCPEYSSLQHWINRFGIRRRPGSCFTERMELGNYVLFSAAMGGKRGVLWDEYGERRFLDNKPVKCSRILRELRAARATNDKVTCVYGEEDYIDPEEKRASAYYEIECEGEKRKFLEVTVTSPSGKVKYQEKIY